MEVPRLKKVLPASVHPAFGSLGLALVAMPVTAAVVGDDRISATFRTNIDMTAKRCSTTPRDGSDNLELVNSQGVLVDEVVALCAEDVGHLDGGLIHSPF